MDGQRFDAMTKAMASGSTRRRALRLAGGGLAGALLAAAGLGKRVAAQENQPVFPNCQEYGGPLIVDPGTDDMTISRPCGPLQGCPDGTVCASAVNPGNRLVCRCLKLG